MDEHSSIGRSWQAPANALPPDSPIHSKKVSEKEPSVAAKVPHTSKETLEAADIISLNMLSPEANNVNDQLLDAFASLPDAPSEIPGDLSARNIQQNLNENLNAIDKKSPGNLLDDFNSLPEAPIKTPDDQSARNIQQKLNENLNPTDKKASSKYELVVTQQKSNDNELTDNEKIANQLKKEMYALQKGSEGDPAIDNLIDVLVQEDAVVEDISPNVKVVDKAKVFVAKEGVQKEEINAALKSQGREGYTVIYLSKEQWSLFVKLPQLIVKMKMMERQKKESSGTAERKTRTVTIQTPQRTDLKEKNRFDELTRKKNELARLNDNYKKIFNDIDKLQKRFEILHRLVEDKTKKEEERKDQDIIEKENLRFQLKKQIENKQNELQKIHTAIQNKELELRELSKK